MGMFSWKTNDTRKSITNRYSERGTFRVYMVDHLGNQWIEDSYNGYGEFGGKDFYELLAEMNGLRPEDALPDDACRGVRHMFERADDYTEKMRLLGIDLWHSGRPFISPQLTEKPRKKSTGNPPQDCPHQGM